MGIQKAHFLRLIKECTREYQCNSIYPMSGFLDIGFGDNEVYLAANDSSD
jgi:hypothetical protein